MEKNVAEGFVLKPVQSLRFKSETVRQGSVRQISGRVILKVKSEAFKEVMKPREPRREPKAPVQQSERVESLKEALSNYVTENRLRNVLSKIGDGITMKDTGALIAQYTKDAMDEFVKDHESEWKALSPVEQKQLKGFLGTYQNLKT